MKTVKKYPLMSLAVQEIELPINAKILAVKPQADKVNLWALVDKEQTIHKKHVIEAYATGDEMPMHKRNYIDSIHLSDGSIVIHFFEAFGVSLLNG